MEAPRERHVVFGAGPLGHAVAAAVLERGHEAVVATRSGTGEVPPGARLVRCDAGRADEVAETCAGTAVVYNCAQPPFTRWPELFPPIQRGLIEGVARTGGLLVAAENLFLYGPVAGPLTEDLPHHPVGRKGEVRARMARELQDAHVAGKLRTASGRGSSFFGPRVRSSFMGPRVLRPAAAGGTVRVVGDPDQPHTYTFIGDFARALVTLGCDERAAGRAWHVPSGPTLTTRRFVELAGEVAGARPAVRRVPRAVVRLGGLAVPLLREVREILYAFEQPFVVDHTRFAATFGDDFTPHEIALGSTLATAPPHTSAPNG